MKRGEISPLSTVSSLGSGGTGQPGTVETMLRQRLRDKVRKDYGHDVALVLYRVSPIPWDWEMVLDLRREVQDILRERKRNHHPFDRGIWIVARGEDGPTLQMVAPEWDRTPKPANA